MPESSIVNSDAVVEQLVEWLGDEGSFLIRRDGVTGAVLRFATVEEAEEQLTSDGGGEAEEQLTSDGGPGEDEEVPEGVESEAVDSEGDTVSGPHTAQECRDAMTSFVSNQGTMRVTRWLELAFEVEPYEIEYFNGMSARLALIHIESTAPRIRRVSTINTHVHLTREAVTTQWDGEVIIRALQADAAIFSEELAVHLDVGEWDTHLFQTIVFKPQLGACTLLVGCDDATLDQLEVEIVEGTRSHADQLAATQETQDMADEEEIREFDAVEREEE